MLGQPVFSMIVAPNSTHEMDISQLKTGIYFIRMEGKENQVIRFAKE
jgi:hypothetical protein